jgi:biopolymer transport protein ExbB/TolQ
MQLQKELKKYETDKLRHYKTYERLQQKAEDKKQYNASINAQFRAGQMAGLFIDKKEINVSGIEGMSRDKLEKRLEELENKINENKKIINITPEEIVERE